jgi:hypothetical protein
MNSYKKYGEYAQAENLKECNHVSVGAGFALLGVVVGAAIALLFAPASGNEMRGTLKTRSEELIDNVRGKVMPFRSRAQTS